MNNFFKLKENGTTVSTEIMAGITTFFCHGLHHCRESKHAVPGRHGMGSCLPGNHYFQL